MFIIYYNINLTFYIYSLWCIILLTQISSFNSVGLTPKGINGERTEKETQIQRLNIMSLN